MFLYKLHKAHTHQCISHAILTGTFHYYQRCLFSLLSTGPFICGEIFRNRVNVPFFNFLNCFITKLCFNLVNGLFYHYPNFIVSQANPSPLQYFHTFYASLLLPNTNKALFEYKPFPGLMLYLLEEQFPCNARSNTIFA